MIRPPVPRTSQGRCAAAVYSIVVACLLTTTAEVYALSWRLRMHDGSKGEAGKTAIVHMRRVDAFAEVIRLEAALPSEGTLPIAEGTWEISVESGEVWSAPLYVTGTQTADIIARPAAQLRAPLHAAGEGLPGRIALLVIPSDPQLQGERLQAEVSCPVVHTEMRCVVPAGTHDLRFIADGFVPELRWDVRLPAGSVTTIDPVTFIKGASVIGIVAKAGRGAMPPEVKITLIPASVAGKGTRAMALHARPNAKGFFRFASVPPGNYVLAASAKELASDSQAIVVIANRTAELNAPLVLDTPKRLQAMIFPSLDPGGRPWAVELMRARPGKGATHDLITAGAAEPDGTWRHKSLRDGHYRLEVRRADESGQWASIAFDIAGADLDLPIAITPIPVAGQIHFGDRAIAAKLHFGGDWAQTRQVLQSDDSGKFEGVLPPGNEESWDVYVEAEIPPIRRTLTNVRGRKDAEGRLHFDLDLPSTVIVGSVTDSAGAPVSNAIIDVRAADGGRSNQVFSDHSGSFQVSGLEPGRHHLTAEAYMRMSELVEVNVAAEDNAPVRLVIKDIQRIRGRVIVGGAAAVIGATLYGIAPNSPSRDIISGTTNEAGAFTLLVPPDTALLDMVITSPGFSTVIGRMPVKSDRPMLVATAQYGGSLVLDTPDVPTVRVVRDGSQLHPRLIGKLAGGTSTTHGTRLLTTVPSLEPGLYSVCSGGRCESGYVPPHGALTLALRD